MERIWKLAIYIFWIIASTALIFVAYILSGNQYNEFTAIRVYAGLAGLAIGIFGGLYTIVSNRTGSKESEAEEQKQD